MRITIKSKLALAFSAIIIMSSVTAWLGISNLSSLNTRLDSLLEGPTQRLAMSLELSAQLLSVVRSQKNLILSTSPTF